MHGFFVTKIIIRDNGVAMSYYDIKNRWLSVGTPHKSRKSFSPILNRETVGEKGMGHFASMMLGDKLVITSNPWKYIGRGRSNTEEELKHIDKTIILKQDWRMYKDGEDFVKIPNEVEVIPRVLPNDIEEKNNHGLTIEISGLKHKWNRDEINRLRVSLKSLVKPTHVKSKSDTEFKPILITKSLGIEEPKGEDQSWLEYAPYKVTAKLRGKKLSWEFTKRSKDGRKRIEQLCSSSINSNWKCGDLEIELYHFPKGMSWWQNTDGLPPLNLPIAGSKLTKWKTENTGVKIYKDNVRIMPYGEPGNDWMQLEKR